jgi:8-oxo-dGTP pyrophosphatase MutT (NUDIX family)
MLTGNEASALTDPAPWGQLCYDESWPSAEFPDPVTVGQIVAAGLVPWSVGFSDGRLSEPVGWMMPSVLGHLKASGISVGPHLRVGREMRVVVAATDLPQLEEILRKTPAGEGWRNEQFWIRDRAGLPLADSGQSHSPLVLERSLFRPLGLLSASVQLNVDTPTGQVWIGQRALHKHIDPGLWDAAVAGGLAAGESPLAAIQREAWEEAGLGPHWWPKIRPLGRVRVCRLLPDCLHHEQVWVFALGVAIDTVLQSRDGEVARFCTVWPDEILQRYRAGLFNHEAACASLFAERRSATASLSVKRP